MKSIGASRAPLDDEWLRPQADEKGNLRAPRLAERVHFPKNARPVGISVGDFFLLYGVTHLGGRIIGAGRFNSPFYSDDGSKSPGSAAKRTSTPGLGESTSPSCFPFGTRTEGRRWTPLACRGRK